MVIIIKTQAGKNQIIKKQSNVTLVHFALSAINRICFANVRELKSNYYYLLKLMFSVNRKFQYSITIRALFQYARFRTALVNVPYINYTRACSVTDRNFSINDKFLIKNQFTSIDRRSPIPENRRDEYPHLEGTIIKKNPFEIK